MDTINEIVQNNEMTQKVSFIIKTRTSLFYLKQANFAIFNALSSLHAFQANDFYFDFFRRRASLEIVFSEVLT